MKKIIASILLIICLSSPALAVLPLAVIPAWAFYSSLTLHGGAAVAAVYYAMRGPSSPAPSPATVSPIGTISRPSEAVWIDLKNPVPPPSEHPLQVKNRELQALMDDDTIALLSNKKDAQGNFLFPAVKAALMDSNEPKQLSVDSGIGETVTFPYGGGMGIISAKSVNSQVYGNNPALYGAVSSPTNLGGGLYQRGVYGGANSGGQGSMSQCFFSYTPTTVVPPPTPTPKDKYNTKLAANGVSGVTKSLLQTEIDKMFQDPDYVPVFTDDTTGLPFAPPPGALSQAQIDQANAAAQRNENIAVNAAAASTTAAAASAAANNASASASAGAANANAVAGAANAAAAATPGDAGLAAAAAAANAAAAAANAAAGVAGTAAANAAANAAAAAAAAADAAGTGPNGDGFDNMSGSDGSGGDGSGGGKYGGYGAADKPEKKGILALLTQFAADSPIVSMVQSFMITTSNGSGIVNVGSFFGSTVVFDFTRWESTFRTLGGVLLVVMHGFAILVVVRGW